MRRDQGVGRADVGSVTPDAEPATDRMPDFDLDYIQYRAQADRPKQYAAGRRCCHDGCRTILSVYNGGETCDLHRPPPDFMRRYGMTFRVCDTCDKLDEIRSFRRLSHGHSTTCLGCEQKQQRATDKADKAAKLKAERDKVRIVAVRGCLRMVKCSECGALKPATSDKFSIRIDGRRCSTCLVCERKRSNDRYYIRRYGMTRTEYRGNS